MVPHTIPRNGKRRKPNTAQQIKRDPLRWRAHQRSEFDRPCARYVVVVTTDLGDVAKRVERAARKVGAVIVEVRVHGGLDWTVEPTRRISRQTPGWSEPVVFSSNERTYRFKILGNESAHLWLRQWVEREF